MKSCFLPGDILVPNKVEFEKWAVIACDQFTSDNAYWNRVESITKGVPTTLDMIFPEIYLELNAPERIQKISHAMERNLAEGIFAEYPNSFVYVERTLLNGMIRPGIVGMVDLEQYHYDPKVKSTVGATEQTILERVPPRIAVRREATLEFPHVILFCSDFENKILRPITNKKAQLKKLYEFDLMEGGGHIAGWLVDGVNAEALSKAIEDYQANAKGTAFLVADGNHSLVTAKCWYEELKQDQPDVDLSAHPARYALVEVEDILDPAIDFEPIHRVIFDTDPQLLVNALHTLHVDGGAPVTWIVGDKRGTVCVDVSNGELPVAVLQEFLDKWLETNSGKLDYIHDVDAVENFAKRENAIGLLLPEFGKKELFEFCAAGRILPRKTFSLGHSREKRYYLEGRKIR